MRGEGAFVVGTVEWARVSVLVENLTDMLLTDDEQRRIHRFGLIDHFRPPRGKVICTENGISYWIEVGRGDARHAFLFDTGLTGMPCLHNMEALGFDVADAESIVISHAHPDHYGGLLSVLERRKGTTPVVVHPDAFLKKVLRDEQGVEVLTVNAGFDRTVFEGLGATVVDAKEPVELAAGTFATGEVPREEPFEPPIPVRAGNAGLFLIRNGEYVNDEGTIDDQAVVINVEGEGLVVLTACGHSGIVNTVRYAQRVAGEMRVAAVMGGFHLGFPGVPVENVEPTVSALKEIAPRMIAPMHCSGFHAQKALSEALPEAYLQNVVGTTTSFGA
jgi:7,8-dihydropterin-6-yl-methyl-4-(beta-D-ribofuranosyl)aminobenzene 5'-phosphate synthase